METCSDLVGVLSLVTGGGTRREAVPEYSFTLSVE